MTPPPAPDPREPDEPVEELLRRARLARVASARLIAESRTTREWSRALRACRGLDVSFFPAGSVAASPDVPDTGTTRRREETGADPR